ncbi:MAG: hypothetical protein M0D57_15930 [Sphingobacteriales bacterium JAD_PAG50586_3]|nr:MAG: hypothetical protein M0D57_15930 [Sphingobacteriales bacterium JAD_PAG50586_3]
MKTGVIISAIALAASLVACTSPEKEVGTTTSNTAPVAAAETKQPEPQPVAPPVDYAYSYTEEKEHPSLYFPTYADTPLELPEPVATFSRTDNIIEPEKNTEVTPVEDNTVASLFDYIAQQNTTSNQINGLFGGVVTGKQGTTLYIPREAFETLDSVDVDGPVTITFQEYFSKADFILAGLSSTSGDKMIESSGMFNVKVTTADGKEVRLKKGKTLRLSLPKNKKALKGSQTFYGEKAHSNSNAPANWQVAGFALQTTKKAQPKEWGKLKSRISFYIAPQYKISQYYKSNEPGKAYVAVMEPNAMKKAEKNLLRYFDERHRYDNYFRSMFHKKKLQDAITGMEDLDTLRLTVEIDDRGKLVKTVAESETMDKEGLQKVKDAFTVKKIFKMNTLHKKQDEYTLFMIKNTPVGYDKFKESFPVGNLNWINIDRFLKQTEPLIALNVDEPHNDKTLFYCVFNKLNSILPGYVANGKYAFPYVPVGANVTIVGVKTDENKNFSVSIGTTDISAAGYKPAPFIAVTPAELKQKLSTAFGETPTPAAVTLATP